MKKILLRGFLSFGVWAFLLIEAAGEPVQKKAQVEVYEIEFKGKKGEERIYSITGSMIIRGAEAKKIVTFFRRPGKALEENLLDQINDYFAIKIDSKFYYVLELERQGYQVSPAKVKGMVLSRNFENRRVLGKNPEVFRTIAVALNDIFFKRNKGKEFEEKCSSD